MLSFLFHFWSDLANIGSKSYNDLHYIVREGQASFTQADSFCITEIANYYPVVISGGIKGGIFPKSEALPHLPPPHSKKKWSKAALFGKFTDFWPLRRILSSRCPPQKKKKIWCRHWSLS